jgi:predicted MPP superfamily phosphohydrolase
MNAVWRALQSLEIGGRRPLLVRREQIPHFDLRKRILFASDLHLRKDGPHHVVEGILDIVLRERPDVILLGGDLVDWRSGLEPLRGLIAKMAVIAPVGAVAGNHDRWIGVNRVRNAVLDGGGHWLEDHPLRWNPDSVAYGSTTQELLPANCHVLCAHDPPPPAARAGFQLVLSGHLHGGQFVLYERGGKLYPGAFAYRWNGLRFQENSSTLLVSRGVRDTLPVRWNCPREVLAVDL